MIIGIYRNASIDVNWLDFLLDSLCFTDMASYDQCLASPKSHMVSVNKC